jgi:hypothetical protein
MMMSIISHNLHLLETATGMEQQQAALDVMSATLSCLPDCESAFVVLSSLIAFETYRQPDRQQALTYLLTSVSEGWKTAAKIEIQAVMKEKLGHTIQ